MGDYNNPNKQFGEGTYGFEGKFCKMSNGSIGVILNKERILLLEDQHGQAQRAQG